MAYPRYIGKGAFQSGTGALTVPALTGTQAGDIIILFVESANETINTPAGYSVLATQIGTGTAATAGGVRIATFYRILGDVADTSTTVADTGDHTTAIKMLFRDTALFTTNIYAAATSTQAATTAMVFPAVTTLTDESLVVLAVAQDTDAASTATVGALTNANLSNLTERHDQTVIAGTGGGLAVITGEKATAGSTGTSTATGSTSVTHAYTTISLSRVAAQTTTTNFNSLTISSADYYPISDAMRITAGSGGAIRATSSGTFLVQAGALGTFATNFKWFWRQYGTDTWTTSTAVASTTSSVNNGSTITSGSFTDNETITGLTNGVEYEVVLFAAKATSYGSDITFSATATIQLSTIITADGGTFSYTGTDANLYNNKLVSADLATFAYAGTDVELLYNRIVTADSGTYSYTGTDAEFLFNKTITADLGTYSYSGTDANLLIGYNIAIDSGTYSYSGTDVSLLAARSIAADAGTYSYTGGDAGLASARTLAADSGTYSYVGTDANILYDRKIVSDSGTYSYTGTDASFIYGFGFNADSGTYSYSGTDASLAITRKLIADTGTFSYSGGTVNLNFSSGIGEIYLGTANLANLKLGSSQIYEVYLGTSQVWGTARP